MGRHGLMCRSSCRPSSACIKKYVRNKIWKYFGYEAECEGKPIDTQRPICKTCFKVTLAKGGNTSNMAKHLSDRHPNFSESSKNDRLANVIINMNTPKLTHIQPNTSSFSLV